MFTTKYKIEKMRKFLILFLFITSCFFVRSQTMDVERLGELLTEVSDTIIDSGNTYRMMYKESLLICIFDESANRMRIISPIVERKDLDEEQLLNAMVANFHTALDVKYALSDEIIWSVFTHPLKELTDYQVLDAVRQVHAAAITFGTTYSSTGMVFPGNSKKEDKPKKILHKS